jgi:hypothetical protein
VTTGSTKSRKARVVSLGQNAGRELRAWRAAQAEVLLRLGVRQNADTFICTRADGSHVKPNALTPIFGASESG